MNVSGIQRISSTGNTNDSQEVGVINPTRAPYNPLNLATRDSRLPPASPEHQ